MANNLPLEKKALVLTLLTEGQSIRATQRITGVDQNTIMTLLVKAGRQAQIFHNSMMLNLQCKRIECDELWSFVAKKQKNLKEGDSPEFGDAYTFVAMDSDSKLVPCYRIGKRTSSVTYEFIKELSQRVDSRFQLSTDAYHAYFNVIDQIFGDTIDYGQVHKTYGEEVQGEKRYSPAPIIRATRRKIMGNPVRKYISTSYIERQNLTVRMHSRRFTRLTNAFSKKLENLEAAVHLHFFHYNFIRIHKTLKVTPAMEAKVTNRLMSWEDLLVFGQERKVA